MDEKEVSHIEIAEEEKVEEAKDDKKVSVVDSLLDAEGWKKDAKKIGLILLAIVIIVGIIFALRSLSGYSFRFHKPMEAVKLERFENDKFGFTYPANWVLDRNEQKKYGSDYLVGFHLQKDDRTGCDVRLSDIGLNFSKSDEQINEAFQKELSASVKGFDGFRGQRLEVGKKDAYKVGFTMTDPLGNSLKINQVLLGNNGENYLLVCGSSASQERFFQNDFDDFFKSFELK